MLKRLLKHLSAPGWWARRAFRADDLTAIGAAVKAAEELGHHRAGVDAHGGVAVPAHVDEGEVRGEIRIAIEGALPLRSLVDKQSCRDRAAALFESLGVAKTREANGILIYVQLVDRRVEILADRGIAALIAQSEWDALCRKMEKAFYAGDYRGGMLEAITRISQLLGVHFPATADNPNELDDAPTVL